MLAIFAILPFFSTLGGGLLALRLRHRLHPIMAFAAGVLVATALVDLLPEAREQVGEDGSPLLVGTAAFVGFLLFSMLEAVVHRHTWEHGHPSEAAHDDAHAHPPDLVLGLVGPLGLIVHSLLDGLAIGLAFRTNVELGLIVGLAVLAHDFGDGMNVVTLALTGGRARGQAIALLTLDALAPVLGAVVATWVSLSGPALGSLLAGFAGVFLAIGAGHLLPEALHRKAGSGLLLLTAAGGGLVLAVRSSVG